MIKKEIAPGIVVYDNVIPDNLFLYKEIQKLMMDSKWITPKWSYAEVEDLEKITSLKLNKLLFDHFDPIEKDYKNFYNIFPEWHDVYGIMKYGPGQGFTNHVDDGNKYHRRVSVVYYLNDDYIGGEINFPRFNIKLKPKNNQIIIFPSIYSYNHSVSPIIKGDKYIVVSFLR